MSIQKRSSEQVRADINVAGITGTNNSIQTNSLNVTGVIKNKVIHNHINQIDKRYQATIEKEPIWYDVRNPVKSFTGRDDELKYLHELLQSESGLAVVSQITSISGLGGIGKSELARKYAYEYKQHYAGNVIWINAETQESLRSSFQGLAEELSINDKTQERDIKYIVKDVHKYFENVKSLFVFDNAVDYKNISAFLPSNFTNDCKLHVLITSRNRDWEVGELGEIKVVQLDVWSPEKAAEFIRKALEIEVKKYYLQEMQIKRLAKQLQYFPLALRQAITYIRERNKTLELKGKKFQITDYFKEYEQNAKNLLNFKSEYENDIYTKTTFITWKVTIENIKHKDHGQVALDILNIMAYLAPDGIPIGKIFSKLVADEEKLWSAIQLLNQYSMINIEKGVSNIHRLVQQVIRLYLQHECKEEQVLGKAIELTNSTNIDTNDSLFISIWNYASIYSKLIDHYYFNSIKSFKKNTLLHIFAKNDCYKTIKAILTYLENNYSISKFVNDLNEDGMTPLHFAAKCGKWNVVKYLIEKGAEFRAPNKYGRTPLHWAAKWGKLDVVKYLVEEKGADSEAYDNYRKTPLLWAAEWGKWDVVKYLLEKNGTDSNPLIKRSETLLHWAAQEGNLDIVKYLIEKGADFNTTNYHGETPLHFAAKCGKCNVVKYFIEDKGADFNASDKHGDTLLHLAAVDGNLNVVKYLIEEKGADFYAFNEDSETPLHWAAKEGNLDIVEYLIEKGADFNAPDRYGRIPLHFAAKGDKWDIVKYLIEEKGADFNASDEDGETLLHLAAKSGEWNVVKYLIKEKGADFNASDKYGETLLHLTAKWGKLDIIKYLIEEKDSDFYASDKILLLATIWGKLHIVKYLIDEKGADINATNYHGETLLHLAAQRGEWEVVNYLVKEKGANLNASDKCGTTLLHLTAKRGKLDIVKYLIEENDADFNASDQYGRTPLHFAARSGEWDVVKYLIEEKGSDFNAPDIHGETLLHLAVEEGNLDIVKYLIEEIGADFSVTNINSKTPLQLATRWCKWDIVKYLIEEKGADFNDTNKHGINGDDFDSCNEDGQEYNTEQGPDFNAPSQYRKGRLYWAHRLYDWLFRHVLRKKV